jgi:hypothetical protein
VWGDLRGLRPGDGDTNLRDRVAKGIYKTLTAGRGEAISKFAERSNQPSQLGGSIPAYET